MDTTITAVRLSAPARRFVLIAAVALAVLSLLLWAEGGFDRAFLLAHNALREHPAAGAAGGAMSQFGMSAICLMLLACIGASFRFPAFREVRPVLLVVLLSFSAAAIGASLLKELLGRARPVADLAGQLNAASRHGSASFPSGHAAKSLALALPFVFLAPSGGRIVRLAKLALLLAASLVCYSRIVLGAHYLSDVLGGAALAFACLPAAIVAANAIFVRGKVTPEKLDLMVRRQLFVLLALTVGLPFL